VSIRVLVADDQALVRSGFRMILDERADMELVGEAEDGAQAVRLAGELDPDVILMDVRMPSVDGVEATRRLVEGGTRAKILVLTTFDLDEYVYAAVRAGASGFLLKDVQPTELVDAIRVVAAGNSLFGPAATKRLVERFGQSPQPSSGDSLDVLTDREREILRLLAEGNSNAELAAKLYLSEATVKTHVSAVLRKLGVRDRVQAVIAAYDAGLVRPAPGECHRGGQQGRGC
jgi:DNA-binding NarL/FixJ family response regulator